MIALPERTMIHTRLPKEAFYQQLSLSKGVKERFVSDVDTFVLENSLTKERLHLTADSSVKEILLLSVNLKTQNYDTRILETIARQNAHKLVFLLCFGELRRLALWYGKLYQTDWLSEERLTLELSGFSLSEIWEHLVEQIALPPEFVGQHPELTLQQRIARAERIAKLEREIKALETKVRREKQFNKQVQMSAKLKKLRRELGDLI